MSKSLALAVVAVGLLCVCAPLTNADVEIAIANGDRVMGTLSPASEIEIVRVTLPKNALLSVAAKGRKSKGKKQAGRSAPMVSFRVLDADGLDTAADFRRAKGKSGSVVTRLPVPATGEYRIEVMGDGANVGDYQLKVKWKAQAKVTRDVQLADGEVAIDFAVDAGATATILAKSARGSDAVPRLLRIERVGDATAIDLDQPDSGSKQHKAKRIRLTDGGDYRVIVSDIGESGTARVTVGVKAPKSGKGKIDIRGAQVGAGAGVLTDLVIGAVIPPAGGGFAVLPGDPFGLAGAALLVPPGAVSLPTALLIGSAPPIRDGLADDVRAAGPTVFFGPAGETFDEPVTVSIPFDALAFGDDFSSLVIVERDERGRTRVVPRPYVVDVTAGTVSFPVSHFTAFRAFGRLPPVKGDLNNDGFADLVVGSTSSGVNRVRVILGGPLLTTRSIGTHDIVFRGRDTFARIGDVAVVGDVSGDGIDDLLINLRGVGNPLIAAQILIFLGGSDFEGSLDAAKDADIVLRGGSSNVGSPSKFAFLTVGRFVGDATLDIATATETSGQFETLVYEGGATLVSDAVAAVTLTGAPGFGFNVANLATGDVSGDGVDDLVIGVPNRSVNPQGVVYVFFGGANFVSGPLSGADVTLTAAAEVDRLGLVLVLAVGDVIGDSAADIVVRSKDRTSPLLIHHVSIFAGGPGLSDGDSSTADVTLTTDGTAFVKFGASLAIADVIGDAKPDLLIGNPDAPTASTRFGRLTIFEGGTSLTSGGPSDADVTIDGTVLFGAFASTLGVQDLDGDGRAELIGVAPASLGEGIAGALHVFVKGEPYPSTVDLADIILSGLDFGD